MKGDKNVANNDIRIRLTGTLDKEASISSINTSLDTISTKLKEIKLDIKINDKTLTTLNNFSDQMKRLSNDALQASKHIEEVINPDGSKIKRTWTGDLAGEFKQTQTKAKETKQDIDKVTDALDKYQRKVANFQKSMRLDMQNLDRTHGGFINQKSLEEFDNQLSKLNPKSKTLTQDMADLRTQFKGVSVDAKSSAGALQQAGVGFREMLTTALEKFPIWMVAATAFYAPIRAVQDMTQRLVELDQQLVSLDRVMNLEDFQLTNILNESIQTADELGSKLTDILTIMNDFGRMGFEGSALSEIARNGQILQNISDLDASGAVDTLTSAMINFNIAGEDSVRIVDALNEVNIIISLPSQ